MANEELNRKLAEWAGFHKRDPKISVDWWRPDGDYEGSKLPNFTQSLDACREWLVPKLRHYELRDSQDKHQAYVNICVTFLEHGEFPPYESSRAETPALAFCLAIEKLINGGK